MGIRLYGAFVSPMSHGSQSWETVSKSHGTLGRFGKMLCESPLGNTKFYTKIKIYFYYFLKGGAYHYKLAIHLVAHLKWLLICE